MATFLCLPGVAISQGLDFRAKEWGPVKLNFKPEKRILQFDDGSSLYSSGTSDDQASSSLKAEIHYVILTDDKFSLVAAGEVEIPALYKFKENFPQGENVIEVFARTNFLGKELGLYYRVVDPRTFEVKQDFIEFKPYGKEGTFESYIYWSEIQERLFIIYQDLKNPGWVQAEWRTTNLSVIYTQELQLKGKEKMDWSFEMEEFFKDGSCLVRAMQREDYNLTLAQQARVQVEDKLLFFSDTRNAQVLTEEGKDSPLYLRFEQENGARTLAVLGGVGEQVTVSNVKLSFAKTIRILKYDPFGRVIGQKELDLGKDVDGSFGEEVLPQVQKRAGSDYAYPNTLIHSIQTLDNGDYLVCWVLNKVVEKRIGASKALATEARELRIARLDSELNLIWEQGMDMANGNVKFDTHEVNPEGDKLHLFGHGRNWLADAENPGRIMRGDDFFAVVELSGNSAYFVSQLHLNRVPIPTGEVRTAKGWIDFKHDKSKEQLRVVEITINDEENP